MSSKVKQKVEINGVPFGVGSIGMRDGTFKELPANVKQGNKLTTLSHLRNCILNGESRGEFSIGNKFGYLFKYNDDNVLVDKDVRMIIAAYKDKTEEPLHICKSKINKKAIKPLEVVEECLPISFKIDANTITLTDHFIKRIRQRFFITDVNCMREFIKDILTNGEYLGTSKDKDLDNEAHLYAKRGVALFISLDGKETVTIYELDRKINQKPRELAKSIFQKRINVLKKDERKLCNRYELFSRKANRQIADYELLKWRARSQSRKMSYQSCIDGLEETKRQYKAEHLDKIKELNEFTKSMIAFT